MRFVVRLFAALALSAAVASPALAAARLLAAHGRSLATVTGDRLFPVHAGENLPGWLAAYDKPAMRIAYRGFNAKEPLPGGRTLLVLRHDGLLGAYVFQGDRCIGQLLAEPLELPDPEAFEAQLRRAAGPPKRGFFTTAGRDYALDERTYVRRLGPLVERRAMVDLPTIDDGRAVTIPSLGLDAIYPADLAERLAPLIAEAESGLAGYWRRRERGEP